MKKFGTVVLIIGILMMGYSGFKFFKEKKRGSEEEVQKENLPFPWIPTSGAILTAIGIMMRSAGNRKKVM